MKRYIKYGSLVTSIEFEQCFCVMGSVEEYSESDECDYKDDILAVFWYKDRAQSFIDSLVSLKKTKSDIDADIKVLKEKYKDVNFSISLEVIDDMLDYESYHIMECPFSRKDK